MKKKYLFIFLIIILFGASLYIIKAIFIPPYSSPNPKISFEDVTFQSGIYWEGQKPIDSYSISWVDFNHDGFYDIWFSRHGIKSKIVKKINKKARLFLNKGNGTFKDIFTTVWPRNAKGDCHGSAWADYDNDGDQDLFVTMGGRLGKDKVGVSNLFLENSQGKLHEKAKELGLGYSLGRGRFPLWIDENNDGLLDILLVNLERKDEKASTALFRQRKNGGFKKIKDIKSQGKDLSFGFLPPYHVINLENHTDILVCSQEYWQADNENKMCGSILNSSLEINSRNGKGMNVSDIAIADFNGDLKSDIFLVRSKIGSRVLNRIIRNNHKVLLAKDNLSAIITSSRSDPFKISFKSEDAVILSTFRWRPGIPESILKHTYTGAKGVTPQRWPLILDKNNKDFLGILDDTKHGLYIGYDSKKDQWDIKLVVGDKEDFFGIKFFLQSKKPMHNLPPVKSLEKKSALKDTLLIQKNGKYVDRTRKSGLTKPTSSQYVVTGDFDNDMDVDIYMGCISPTINLPNIYYENKGDGTFVKIPDACGASGYSGTLSYTEVREAEKIAVADYDNDGFLDILLSEVTFPAFTRIYLFSPPVLLRNKGNTNNWIEIDLEGTVSNRDAIGARVIVTAGGKSQLREQLGGCHTYAQNSKRLHFGLGKNKTIEEITITWPSGIVQKIKDIKANQILHIKEKTE